jgi:hypothetical protein
MSDGGKGSSPRPYSVSQKIFSENWDRIFKKSKTNSLDDPQHGSQQITKEGILQEFREGYWNDIENKQ